ncbi:GNAT family N-acetyltransferase [Cellulomonas sp. NPDC057328]|uniref:GNAT family N-acetyltransferase n=1 Tax=Cellulomonas sp. NPDC057328 TaxID=3346101 RepID=UPI00362F9EBF
MTDLLRPWRAADLPALLDAVRAGDDLPRQLDLPPAPDDDAVAARLRSHLLRWERTAYVLAVTADDRPVGSVALTQVERTHGTAWVSYWTAPAARGRGLTTAAVATAARWALDVLGLERLELGHRVNNPASCRVATRAGFVAEGVERAKLRYDGVRYDVETHARLATDPVPELPTLLVEAPAATP